MPFRLGSYGFRKFHLPFITHGPNLFPIREKRKFYIKREVESPTVKKVIPRSILLRGRRRGIPFQKA